MGRVGPQATVSELSLMCDINRDFLMELMLQHMNVKLTGLSLKLQVARYM